MRINVRRLVRIVAVTLLLELALLSFVHVAEACACSGHDPMGFANWFNGQSVEYRMAASYPPVNGYRFTSEEHLLVPMNLCGQIFECEEVG